MQRTVAILGRPNVGKSTLFNRLVGRRQAIVAATPGVTRDRLEGSAAIGGFAFRVVDTAGLETGEEASLPGRLRAQTLSGLALADVGLLVIDAKAGITAGDEEIAELLRRQKKPVVLVANKAEGGAAVLQSKEAWRLGLGEPIPISALEGDGFADLLLTLAPYLEDAAALPEAEAPPRPLRLAIVGRPNVGKSSLVNRLLREERLLTGPEPGLTRDAVRIAWSWGGREIELVDTAGLRRRSRVAEALEKLSSGATVRALKMAEVVVLVIDAVASFERQDLTIAKLALDEGRALVLVLNKWDLVTDAQARLARAQGSLETLLADARGVTLLPLSAQTGRGVERLLPAVVEAERRWSSRVPTAALNRWLHEALDRHAPPLAQGRRIKIRYATQSTSRPPTFVLFANKPAADLPASYLRYLVNDMRDAFDLKGVPIRLAVRRSKNPYVDAD